MRYAATSARGMLRETFDPDRFISAAALDHWVVALTVTGGLVDLRTDDTLDALGLDDQINTSREPRVWQTAQQLGDLLWEEYARRRRPAPALVYRSRTTPQHNANLAFFQHSVASVVSVTRLRDLPALLEAAITADGFTVEL